MYQQMEVLIIDSRAPSLARLGGTGGCAKGWRIFFQGEERITHDVLNYFDEALLFPSSIPLRGFSYVHDKCSEIC